MRIDFRWGGGDTNRMRALTQELVGLQPDIIVVIGPATVAVQRATRTIPIVFVGVGDPVATGIVPRLDRPGGNVTGLLIRAIEPTPFAGGSARPARDRVDARALSASRADVAILIHSGQRTAAARLLAHIVNEFRHPQPLSRTGDRR